MIRAVWLGGLMLLAGCASPVVTRIDTTGMAAPATPLRFALAEVPGELGSVQQKAVDQVVAALEARGYRQGDMADHLLSVTLSDRPAGSGLLAGDDAGQPVQPIAPAATRSNNRGCARRDHRLSVHLTDRVTGAVIYSGSAAEFHCKAPLEQSLPHLVRGALDGLDGATGARQVEREGVR